LLLQTARFLVKAWKQALNGKPLTPTVEYLKRYVKKQGQRETFNGSTRGLLEAMQAAAAGKIANAFALLDQRKKQGRSHEEAVNLTSIELARASELHCFVFLVHSAIEVLEGAARSASSSLAPIFNDILELYVVDTTLKKLGDILQYVNITSSDIRQLQNRLEVVLAKIRPNAVGIVDSFDIPDGVLNSVIGAYDGNVYERLLTAAKSSPLNQEDVPESFEKYLKPFMKSNL